MPQLANGAVQPRPAISVAEEYLARLGRLIQIVPSQPLADAIEWLLDARSTGHRVYVMGNGGSAASASHLVCDLVKTAEVEGFAPLRCVALADSGPLVTAWANDVSYEQIFAQQIRAFAEPGDVLIGISASGNSPNIVAGFAAANAAGLRTIGFLGFDGGAARHLVDLAVHIPSFEYGLVEDVHAALSHAITAAIRQVLLSAR